MRKNIETTQNISSNENNSSNENLIKSNVQHQTNRKIPLNNRSSSKNGIHRTTMPTSMTTTTLELLPPIVSGKRLHIPIGNHRYL